MKSTRKVGMLHIRITFNAVLWTFDRGGDRISSTFYMAISPACGYVVSLDYNPWPCNLGHLEKANIRALLRRI